MMKKVGVITFSDTTHNYGQILQCFAMQQVLKRIGCDPFLVQYDKNTRCSYKYLTLRSKIVKLLSSASYHIEKKITKIRKFAYNQKIVNLIDALTHL